MVLRFCEISVIVKAKRLAHALSLLAHVLLKLSNERRYVIHDPILAHVTMIHLLLNVNLERRKPLIHFDLNFPLSFRNLLSLSVQIDLMKIKIL